jgi:hypothetical protein
MQSDAGFEKFHGVLEGFLQEITVQVQGVDCAGPGGPRHYTVCDVLQDIQEIYIGGNTVLFLEVMTVELTVAVPPGMLSEVGLKVAVEGS